MKSRWEFIDSEIPHFRIITPYPVEGYFSTKFGMGFLNPSKFISLKQIHSERVHYVKGYEHLIGDALITDIPELTIAVKVADCFPIYLIDPRTPAIGLIHAGWRGSIKGIQRKTVKKMVELFGTRPDKLEVLFGPGISSDVYTVGEEVAKLFGKYAEKRKGNYFLDLYGFNRDELIKVGVLPTNIAEPPACTYKRPDLFFSYRRDGKILGEMRALLKIKKRD
jgi:hypothetical protein